MYYLANLRNKVLIIPILPNTLFKPKRKDKKVSYNKLKL